MKVRGFRDGRRSLRALVEHKHMGMRLRHQGTDEQDRGMPVPRGRKAKTARDNVSALECNEAKLVTV